MREHKLDRYSTKGRISLIAVVFDLELVKRFKKGQLSEIVEIGACKVDLESKKITDQFQIYILPRSGYVSKSTRMFINMDREQMDSAVPFQEGITQFVDWLGDEYYLCSWGRDDKFHFIDQCLRNKIDLHWLKNYNDIQRQIGTILSGNSKNQLGLKNALDLAEIEPIGKAHRGIDDALNTAELLLKFVEQITLDMNTLSTSEIDKQKKKRPHTRHKQISKEKKMNESKKQDS